MGSIITIATSVASAMLVFLLQHFIRENARLKHEKETAQKERDKALEDGVVCLLRVKLIEYHAKYMEHESISSNGFQNWMLMFKAYHALGGNGMVDHMKQEIEELHIK